MIRSKKYNFFGPVALSGTKNWVGGALKSCHRNISNLSSFDTMKNKCQVLDPSYFKENHTIQFKDSSANLHL